MKSSRITSALVSALAALSGVTSIAEKPASAQIAERPNILIIVTDDQRADTMAVMPRTRRWFQGGGTAFTQAFATTPLCCPSRASIMTGMFAHNHRVLQNAHASRLDHDDTIQAYLDPTYQTAIVGKFLNAWPTRRDPPHFDRWATTAHGEYFRPRFNFDGDVRRVDRYVTTVIRRRALGILDDFEDDDADPWYLYVAPTAPHRPFSPEQRFADAPVPPWSDPPPQEDDRTDKPRYVRQFDGSLSEARVVRRRQLRTLMSVDVLVGRIMRRLADFEEENTMAFFLSDNGYMWSEHGMVGLKGVPYDPSIRVPFMWRWPGLVDADATEDGIALNIDIAPTIYEATGVVPDTPVDGKSLFHSVREHALTERWRLPNGDVPTWASIRTAEYHYIENYRSGELVTREYYDLSSDPHELHNLMRAEDPPDTTEPATILDLARECEGTTCP